MNSVRTKLIIRAAVMTALIAVSSQLSIPLPSGVPITLQTFAVAFAGYFLGAKAGAAAVLAYIVLGAAGAPVFASFTGGAQALVGLTGGFLIGFVPMAFLSGLSRGPSRARGVALGTLGLAVCHLMGALQFSLVSGTGFFASLALASLPYILKDILSVVGARLFTEALERRTGKRAALGG